MTGARGTRQNTNTGVLLENNRVIATTISMFESIGSRVEHD